MLRADIAPDAKGERDMLAEQLDSMNRDDLLVLDRGYPAYCLFALLNQRDRAFCMRLATSLSPQVRAFVASGHASAIVTVEPGKEQFPAFKKHDLPSSYVWFASACPAA